MNAETLNWFLGALSFFWMVLFFWNSYFNGKKAEQLSEHVHAQLCRVGAFLTSVLDNPVTPPTKVTETDAGTITVYQYTESQIMQMRTVSFILSSEDTEENSGLLEQQFSDAVEVNAKENAVMQAFHDKQEDPTENIKVGGTD